MRTRLSSAKYLLCGFVRFVGMKACHSCVLVPVHCLSYLSNHSRLWEAPTYMPLCGTTPYHCVSFCQLPQPSSSVSAITLCVAAPADLPPFGISLRRACVSWYFQKDLWGSENQRQGTAKNLQPGECDLGESVMLLKGGEENRVLSEKPWCQRPLESHKVSCLETNDAPRYCLQQENATSAIIQSTSTVFFSWLNGRSKKRIACSIGSRVSPCPQLTRDHRLSAVASEWSVPTANLMSWRLEAKPHCPNALIP